MIRGKFMTSMDDTSPIFDIRMRVFVEEQGFLAETERDEFDNMAIYALVFDEDDRPAGTGRLYVDLDNHFRVSRICVLKDARGQGLGDLIMRMLLYRAQELNVASVYIEAQLPVVEFYARYGFQPFGDIRYNEGAAHRMMKAEASEINIEGTCGGHKACGGCEGDCASCDE